MKTRPLGSVRALAPTHHATIQRAEKMLFTYTSTRRTAEIFVCDGSRCTQPTENELFFAFLMYTTEFFRLRFSAQESHVLELFCVASLRVQFSPLLRLPFGTRKNPLDGNARDLFMDSTREKQTYEKIRCEIARSRLSVLVLDFLFLTPFYALAAPQVRSPELHFFIPGFLSFYVSLVLQGKWGCAVQEHSLTYAHRWQVCYESIAFAYTTIRNFCAAILVLHHHNFKSP